MRRFISKLPKVKIVGKDMDERLPPRFPDTKNGKTSPFDERIIRSESNSNHNLNIIDLTQDTISYNGDTHVKHPEYGDDARTSYSSNYKSFDQSTHRMNSSNSLNIAMSCENPWVCSVCTYEHIHPYENLFLACSSCQSPRFGDSTLSLSSHRFTINDQNQSKKRPQDHVARTSSVSAKHVKLTQSGSPTSIKRWFTKGDDSV